MRGESIARIRVVSAIVVLCVAALMLVFMARMALREHALMAAATNGSDEAGVELLQSGVFAGQTARLQAVCDLAFKNHRPKIALALIRQGFTPRTSPTPIVIAAASGCPEALPTLLDRGFDINMRDDQGRTALTWAVEQANLAVVPLLLAHGANVNATARDGDTALIIAINYTRNARSRARLVETLVDAGAEVNASSQSGLSPLVAAEQQDDVQLIQFLLRRGASVDWKPKSRNSGSSLSLSFSHSSDETYIRPLSYAVMSRDPSILRLLLSHSKSEATIDDALIKAVSHNCVPQFKILSAGRVRPHPRTREWLLAVNAARLRRDPEMLRLLKPFGVDGSRSAPELEVRNDQLETPLLHAFATGNFAEADKLIKQGADVNARDRYDNTPLLLAAQRAPALVRPLLERHADPNVVAQNGESALKCAALSGNGSLVSQLLAHRADSNLHHPPYHSVLHYALKHKQNAVAELLKRAGGRDE